MWVNIYLLYLLTAGTLVPARLLLDRDRVRRQPNLEQAVGKGKENDGLRPVTEKTTDRSWNSTETSQPARRLLPTIQPNLYKGR